jgi:hypothetical protein
VTKLTGSNFKTWATDVEILLDEKKLWIYATGEAHLPADASAKKKEDFEDKKKLAYRLIYQLCSDPVKQLIAHTRVPREAWTKLEDTYAPKHMIGQISSVQALFSTKLKGSETMIEYINRFRQTYRDFCQAGNDELSDQLIGHLMILGLPSEYSNIKSMASMLKKDEFSSLRVEEMLISEYGQRKYQEDSTSTERKGILTTKSLLKQDKSRDLTCYYCGKKGHIKKHCRKLKADTSSGKIQLKVPEKKMPQLMVLSPLLATCETSDAQSCSWILDSGASMHVSPYREDFYEFRETRDSVLWATDSKAGVMGIGKVRLQSSQGVEITLSDVLYVPIFKYRLLSLGAVDQKGATFAVTRGKLQVFWENECIFTAVRKDNNLYHVQDISILPSVPIAANVLVKDNSLLLWHRRLGHTHMDNIKKMQRLRLVKGLENFDLGQVSACEDCLIGKSTRQPFRKKTIQKQNEILELVHSDLCGPMRDKSGGGALYVMTFVDDHSRMSHIYFLRRKSDAFLTFQRYHVYVERITGRKLKRLHSDNGGEYSSKEFNDYLQQHGIEHKFTTAYSPQENGVAERLNRTLLNATRTMLVGANLPISFWAEAMNTANFLHNVTLTRSCQDFVPSELWSGWKPSISYLKVFGCRAYMHIPKEKRHSKLERRAKITIMIGYASGRKAYRLWDPDTQDIIETRDVRFDEQKFDGLKSGNGSLHTLEDIYSIDTSKVGDGNEDEDSTSNEFLHPTNLADDSCVDDTESEADETHGNRDMRSILRERTDRVKPGKYTALTKSAPKDSHSSTPLTYKDAVEGPDSDLWKIAIDSEVNSILEKNVWELVDRPYHRKPIRGKWKFKVKYNPDGTVDKYKARLVAQGFNQEFGIDYEDTYSPVASLSTFRLLYSIAVKKGWHVEHMDVKTAYLNGHLEEDIYMEIPEGFAGFGSRNRVCKLVHSLYGLKQSGKCWNAELDRRLIKQGLKRSCKDPCVYYRSTVDGRMFVIVYVDDLVLITETEHGMEKLKDNIKAESEVAELGNLKFYLKLVSRKDEEGNVYLSQGPYIRSILDRYGMSQCKPVSTPLDPGIVLQKNTDDINDETKKLMEKVPYRQAIGSLQYLVQGTRPDIAFAVSKLGQYSSNPEMKHWNALKHVLRYLQSTADFELKIEIGEVRIDAFCDADWASCIDERKSQTGYLVRVGNSPVIWKSYKQKCISLSTQEAEYISITECTKEILWITQLLKEIGLEDCYQYPIRIRTDNQAAMILASKPIMTGRSKHIEIKYHFVQDVVARGIMKLEYVQSTENAADIFTKALPKLRHHDMVKLLSISEHGTKS